MRDKLPSRRESPAIGFHHGKLAYRVGVGLRDDGSCGEIFLDGVGDKDKKGAKGGSDADGVMCDLATMASLLLQHGYSPENLARRLSLDGLARAALTYAARIEREIRP